MFDKPMTKFLNRTKFLPVSVCQELLKQYVGWLEFNVSFQHIYGYIGDDSKTVKLRSVVVNTQGHLDHLRVVRGPNSKNEFNRKLNMANSLSNACNGHDVALVFNC